jgi:putative ABC transport system substrate-binding protein
MKRSTLIVSLILLLTIISEALAAEVLVVQSYKVKPYENALRGFKSVARDITFSEQEPSTDVVRNIRRIRPDLILAIGTEALQKVKRIRNIPILYMMVLSSDVPSSLGTNITGVSMKISPEKQLAALRSALPGASRVGVLYDPEKNGHFVRRAVAAAKGYGLEITAKEIRSTREVPKALLTMRGNVDALWILPDITVVTPETTSFMLLFSIQNRIPILAFSSRFLEMGALLSVEIDPFDTGRQTGEMAVKILSGTDIAKIPPTDAANAVISVNFRAAKKMGIKLSEEIQNKARIVR